MQRDYYFLVDLARRIALLEFQVQLNGMRFSAPFESSTSRAEKGIVGAPRLLSNLVVCQSLRGWSVLYSTLFRSRGRRLVIDFVVVQGWAAALGAPP